MRTFWWACIFVGVLTCSAAYQHVKQPSLPTRSPGASEQSERHAAEEKPEQPLAYKEEGPLHYVDSADAGLETDQSPNAQKEVRLEDAAGAGTIEQAELNDTKRALSYLAYYAYSEVPPETKPADTVLNSLKDIPPGIPVDEIKRVSDLLGF